MINHPYIRLEHKNPENNNWFVVNWCLGNTCNYACSYCPIGLHDGSKLWPELDTIKSFISKVKNHHQDKGIYFEFTGGEVTVYKHFIDVCKFCTELGIKVGLISNGSRTLRYWEKNKQYFDHVCLSFHPEFVDENHFIEVIKVLHNDTRVHVNIMMSPEKFDYCFEVANKIKDLGNISMALQPLIVDFGDTLFDYTLEQKSVLDNQSKLIADKIKFDKEFLYYRGSMRMVFSDGTKKIQDSQKLIADKTNNWLGWKCYAGVEQLIVDMDGLIYRGWCKVGKVIGHINDIDLKLPITPIICTKTMCHCNYDIMSTKEQ
jgi:MoaA/NifB/PqqE/SkfB family radical SAM enzyme